MSKWKSFLKWLSTIVPFRIPAGKGTTIEEIPEVDESRLVINAPKYRVKPETTFVYVNSRRNTKGQAVHELVCQESKLSLIVSDTIFKTLFENISLKEKV